MQVIQRRELFPFRLVYAQSIDDGRELVPVFRLVYARGFRTEDVHAASVQTQSQVVRYLAAHGHYHSVRLFEFVDIHHPFICELVEIQTVAHIIVRRDRFRVVVYHHASVAFVPDGLEGIHRTPVEFH